MTQRARDGVAGFELRGIRHQTIDVCVAAKVECSGAFRNSEQLFCGRETWGDFGLFKTWGRMMLIINNVGLFVLDVGKSQANLYSAQGTAPNLIPTAVA